MASSAKEQKVQASKCNREFQVWWTEKHGIISKGDKVVCVLCSGKVVIAEIRGVIICSTGTRNQHRTRGRKPRSDSENRNKSCRLEDDEPDEEGVAKRMRERRGRVEETCTFANFSLLPELLQGGPEPMVDI
ncbi:hypothetical protein TNCV_1012241 [Trichonephila clavipes]|uniref:Uncharacterized protein n=1 Tax=Trichonephila clavipes TaxID=2585209 RepID=A0A8X6VXG1_TRICX|nr:hypothetical protein TNCV_1012241 [Trichonephila clavipes]